jgi:hypothetical protein
MTSEYLPASSSNSDYRSRHQKHYEDRVRKESELESIEADAALAKSLQEAEESRAKDAITAHEISESIQHPENPGTRAPLRTGYTERLIEDDPVPVSGGFWSIFYRSVGGDSQRLLPVSTTETNHAGFSRILALIWANWRSITILLVIVLLTLYIMHMASSKE